MASIASLDQFQAQSIWEMSANRTLPRRGYRWMLVATVSTLAAAGLLVALSPGFRSDVQDVSKYFSTTSWDDADYDNELALNELSEEDSKDALSGGRHSIQKGLFGVDGEARIKRERDAKAGATDDFLSVGDLIIESSRGQFESQQSGAAQQFSNKAGRTNAESIAGNEQSKQIRSDYFGDSFGRLTNGFKPALQGADGDLGSRPNITNQPTDPDGKLALDKKFRMRSLRADKFLKVLEQAELKHVPFPAEPSVNWPPEAEWKKITERREKWKTTTNERDQKQGQAGQTPVASNASDPLIFRSRPTPEQLKKLNVRFKQRDVKLGRKIAPGSNSASTPSFGDIIVPGDGVIRLRQIITSPLPPAIAYEGGIGETLGWRVKKH
jgi:hypothetical protein